MLGGSGDEAEGGQSGQAANTSGRGGEGGTSTSGRGGAGGGASAAGSGGTNAAGTGGAGGATDPADSGADGWTAFEPLPGAQVIHVSNAGNDGAAGTVDAPLATLAAGYERLRDGQADWLLLRRGDSFVLDATVFWSKSGPPDPESGWMRFGAYGDSSQPRPVVDSGAGFAYEITPGFQSARRITSLAFTDIHFRASARLGNPAGAAPLTAIALFAIEWGGTQGAPFEHILFENLKVEGYSLGFQTGDDVSDWRVRRCIVTEIFVPGGDGARASGLLTSAQGIVLEDNVFYRIQYPGMPSVTAASFQSHAAYVTAEARGVVARGNFIINATEGFMVRAGGTYVRNVSAHNLLGVQFGQANGVTPTPGGVEANIRENLILNAGEGANVGNVASGQVEGNLLVRDTNGLQDIGMRLIGYNSQPGGDNIGVHDTEFSGNHLSGGFGYSASMNDTQSYSGLRFEDNTTEAGAVVTSIGAFMSESGIAGTTIEDFAGALLARDRAAFPPELTSPAVIDHYRASVGMQPLR